MDATNNIATDLFYKIRSRFSGLKLGAETGQITIMPEEARFFDFDYMEGQAAIGHVSISLAEQNSMKVYFSHGITEGMDDGQKESWYGFLRELRQFAKRRLLSFDTRDIAKDNLDRRDYEFLSQNAQIKPKLNTIQKPVGESIMSESAMYGSRNMSYQKLMDTRLIVKHSQAVMDDTQPGARTRNISALFVENQDGERFKYPFIHLAGARAMQRHVANNGLPYDDIGKSIVRMSEEIAALKSFGGYVVRNDLMNSETNEVVERSNAYLNSLREQIKALSKQSHYEAYRENFQAYNSEEIPQDVVEDFKEKFTVKSFKEDIARVFPVLFKLMKEGNTIGYDDIVAMTAEEIQNEELDVQIDNLDPFTKFENWVMALGEESAITSEDPEEQQAAIQQLQSLVGEHFPAGVDGSNAIESLKGVIDDPELFKRIKEQAAQDPDSCVRPLIKDWLELNAPETLEQLDFGDMVDDSEVAEPAAPEAGAEVPATVPAEEPQMASDDPDERNQSMGVKELAEFIHSFYDKESGTFPKGPEGVCTMVGKKFGEQAESVARKFVERMAPQQTSESNPELARIQELAGVSEGPLDKLKAAGKAVGSAVAGAATGVKKFFHKTAQHAVDEYMEKKYPGKEADTPQKKDAALALYLIDKGTLDRADLDKLKPMLAKAGTGLFELCMDLKIDFNQENAGGRLLKIIYPDGMTKKDADGNITSFMMKPNEDVQEGPMWDKVKDAGSKVMNKVADTVFADDTAYRNKFEKWIDSKPGLAQHKEELLSNFDKEIERGGTPEMAGHDALEDWKRKSREMNKESNDELLRVKALAGM